jgi:hypothetical protein
VSLNSHRCNAVSHLCLHTSYFASYELIKRGLAPKGADASELNLLHVLTAGGLAGMAMVSGPRLKQARHSHLTLSYDVYSGRLHSQWTSSSRDTKELLKAPIPVSFNASDSHLLKKVSVGSSRELPLPS